MGRATTARHEDRAAGTFFLLFGVVWTGFAVIWTVAVLLADDGPMFLLGVVFVVIGVANFGWPLLQDTKRRGRTVYGLTDQRALIVLKPPGRSVSAVSLDRAPEVHLTEHRDGCGTIRFGAATAAMPFGAMPFGSFFGFEHPPEFRAVEDGRRVFDLVQRAIAARTVRG